MSENRFLGTALLLLLIALPLVSLGMQSARSELWKLGLGAFAVGGVVSLLTRLVRPEKTGSPPDD